ncbi:hypothetical protein DFJ74DRAFT_453898 [Hyaloraphidium curvatum]|nr:hypothetical protein DFJ74DRAFT_453898 [Hyaloraphidium curvatum]
MMRECEWHIYFQGPPESRHPKAARKPAMARTRPVPLLALLALLSLTLRGALCAEDAGRGRSGQRGGGGQTKNADATKHASGVGTTTVAVSGGQGLKATGKDLVNTILSEMTLSASFGDFVWCAAPQAGFAGSVRPRTDGALHSQRAAVHVRPLQLSQRGGWPRSTARTQRRSLSTSNGPSGSITPTSPTTRGRRSAFPTPFALQSPMP